METWPTTQGDEIKKPSCHGDKIPQKDRLADKKKYIYNKIIRLKYVIRSNTEDRSTVIIRKT
jgi:hypothetical protein